MINISRPIIGIEEEQAVIDVLRSGQIAQGRKVEELERIFAAYCGTAHGIALNSGTAALHTALKVAGVKRGDEVITAPFTFIATANSILMQQATPIFCDIDQETYTIDPAQIEEKTTKNTKAIIAIDLFGQLADYQRIEKFCKEKGIALIEDAAQSVGAEWNGRRAGAFGNLCAFSFYATKNITCGEGGMLTTNDNQYANAAKRFRQHGRKDLAGYDYDDLGFNYRTTDLQAAMMLEQMKKLEGFTKKRIENAKRLSEGIQKIKGLSVPHVRHGRHVFHQYTIEVDESFPLTRDELSAFLRKKEIGTGVYYPLPLHLCTSFRNFGYKEGDFPLCEAASKKVLSLPVHPSLTDDEIETIIRALKEGSHAKA